MEDINCPYCDAPQDIDHDDGNGYEEDKIYLQTCQDCDKVFSYTTSISFYYEPAKADCQNEGEHNWQKARYYPPLENLEIYDCPDCGERKQVIINKELIKK